MKYLSALVLLAALATPAAAQNQTTFRNGRPATPDWGLFPLSVTEERYGLGNGNDLYLLSELRAVHHPSYHMLLRRYGMAASSPHQPLVHHCRELPVGDLRL